MKQKQQSSPPDRTGAPQGADGRLRKMPIVLLVLFLGLFLAGVVWDEPSRVLEQARSICLACIGIG